MAFEEMNKEKTDIPERAEELLKELMDLFPNVDEKTQKMIRTKYAATSLEHEQSPEEIRIFCMFWNSKTGKYRVTNADAVIVDNIAREVSFPEAINAIIAEAKDAGEKIAKKDINV
jgi:hypothetical protein